MADRVSHAESIARAASFTRSGIRTDGFLLTAFSRLAPSGKAESLTVYIEGDGLAWVTRTQLSTNPTPANPTALQLAVQDRAPSVVYLARPCQYTDPASDPKCQPTYWSGRRFAEEVIASTNQAIDQVKARSGARRLHLVGYSGGGAVAALVAARRDDVASLRTVAGNLDHVALHRHHKVTQLTESLNAVNVAKSLKGLPQRHYAGADDTVVPPFIAEGFARAVADSRCVRAITVRGANHHDGWVALWPSLLRQPVACEPE
ncbi:MAG: alpha/beta hydrolase [Alphaproteobacteria bacterium]